jgi:hypothetical protein
LTQEDNTAVSGAQITVAWFLVDRFAAKGLSTENTEENENTEKKRADDGILG